MGIAGLLVGSIAYYRIVVSGSIEGSTGTALIDVNAYAIIYKWYTIYCWSNEKYLCLFI